MKYSLPAGSPVSGSQTVSGTLQVLKACSWYVIVSPPLSVLLVARGSQLNKNSWEPTVDGVDELCMLNSL